MEEKMTNKEVGSQLRSLRTKAKIAKVLTLSPVQWGCFAFGSD